MNLQKASRTIQAQSNRYRDKKVAIIHYWLVGMRGGEKVIESLCRMFPQADIFTHVVDRDNVSDLIKSHRIQTTRISQFPFPVKMYQKYLPFMPRALEEIDLTGYDLVISSESGPAKGVIVPPHALHLCYCHSPMRYLWDQYHLYHSQTGLLSRLMMPHLTHKLRQWDVTSAARVDGFVANSHHVAARIQKYWRRPSRVVHPPVAVEQFAPVLQDELEDYYLLAGELVGYKRPDLAIEAFRQMDKPLIVIGGPDKMVRALSTKAGPKTQFLGKVPFESLKQHMARCKALIFPGEEDFGIVPVEVMASGRPVIGYGRGGVLDSVVDGQTGLFFQDQDVNSLIGAVERFEASPLSKAGPEKCVARAAAFSETCFQNGILDALDAIGAHQSTNISAS